MLLQAMDSMGFGTIWGKFIFIELKLCKVCESFDACVASVFLALPVVELGYGNPTHGYGGSSRHRVQKKRKKILSEQERKPWRLIM